MRVSGALVVGLLACGHDKAAPDAAQVPPSDTTQLDAPPPLGDAPSLVDAPPDAVPEISPACTTAPSVLIDLGQDQMSSVTRLGDALYMVVYHDNNGTPETPRVVVYDIATGAPVGNPTALAGLGTVWPAPDAVYAGEGIANGSIWRFVPGAQAVRVVTGRPTVKVITEDAPYVYWSEAQSVGTDLVKRQLIAGGPVEDVMVCDAERLLVADATLYCAAFQGRIDYAPKAGGGPMNSIAAGTGLPIFTLLRDGSALYFGNGNGGHPTLFGAPLPTGPAVILASETTLGNYAGLAATSAYFYGIDMNAGIRRIDRSTYTGTLISHLFSAFFDPMIWNGQLYFADLNATDGGYRIIRHCID